MLQMQRNKQGDLNPEATPDEKGYYDNLTAAVGGTVSPVGRADTAKESLLRGILNSNVESGAGMEATKALQQPLSRAVDFADRTAQQLKQAKFDRIKKFLGQ